MILLLVVFMFELGILILGCAAITELVLMIVHALRRRKQDPDSLAYRALTDLIRASRTRLIAELIALAACVGLIFLLSSLIVFNM